MFFLLVLPPYQCKDYTTAQTPSPDLAPTYLSSLIPYHVPAQGLPFSPSVSCALTRVCPPICSRAMPSVRNRHTQGHLSLSLLSNPTSRPISSRRHLGVSPLPVLPPAPLFSLSFLEQRDHPQQSSQALPDAANWGRATVWKAPLYLTFCKKNLPATRKPMLRELCAPHVTGATHNRRYMAE